MIIYLYLQNTESTWLLQYCATCFAIWWIWLGFKTPQPDFAWPDFVGLGREAVVGEKIILLKVGKNIGHGRVA